MKAKKVLLIVLAVLLVLSPSIALAGCYLHSRNVQSEIVIATIKDAPGIAGQYKKGEELFELFKNTLGTKDDTPTALTALPEKALSFARFEILYTDTFNAESSYTYYISEDENDCYFTDGENRPFRIAQSRAAAFLDSDYSEKIYAASVPPVLTVGGKTLTPYTLDWSYKTIGGKLKQASVSYVDRNEKNEVESFLLNFSPDFSEKPDTVEVEVKEKENGEVLYSGAYDGLQALMIEGSKDVSVDLTAVWNNGADKKGTGTAKYFFEGKLYGNAAFKISGTTAHCGDVLILSAFNVIDTSEITVTTDPAISFPLKFYKVGESWQALLPIAADAVKTTTKVTMTVSSPSATDVFLLDISPLNGGACKYYGPDQATLFTDTVLASLKSVTDPIAQAESSFSFTGGKFVTPASNYFAGASSSAMYSYGAKVTLMSINKTYTALEKMYCANANNLGKDADGNTIYGEGKSTSVLAAFAGKVVYVGTTSITGRMIVIDHGSGMKSWYTNLSSDIAVKAGDSVAAGQFLSHAANGGLNASYNFNFRVAVTVNGVAVNIDTLIEKGLIAERY